MIPGRPAEVTAAWLRETSWLRETGPGAMTVSDVGVVAVRDATNCNATLRLVHDDPSLPSAAFLKLPPLDPDRRARLDWQSMARREVRFYRDLAHRLDLVVPEVYVAALDDETGDFLLLMEDLEASGHELPDPDAGLDPQRVRRALAGFAALHARYEDAGRRQAEAGWLTPSGRTSDYGARLLREGIDSGAALGSAFVAVAERYIADRDLLQDAWELGPTTVLHGDAHLGNVYVPSGHEGGLGLFDWGLMTVGSPLRDVSYFITMVLSPDNRRAHERDLLAAYLEARRRAGASEIDEATAWRWHRLQSAYTVVASCQTIVLPDDAGPERRRFAEAFLHRAASAVDDLDAPDAIDAHAASR